MGGGLLLNGERSPTAVISFTLKSIGDLRMALFIYVQILSPTYLGPDFSFLCFLIANVTSKIVLPQPGDRNAVAI